MTGKQLRAARILLVGENGNPLSQIEMSQRVGIGTGTLRKMEAQKDSELADGFKEVSIKKVKTFLAKFGVEFVMNHKEAGVTIAHGKTGRKKKTKGQGLRSTIYAIFGATVKALYVGYT